MKGFPSSLVPWWIGKLRKGQLIAETDLSRLPKKASAEKRGLEALDVKSLVALPVKVNGELAGFLGLHDPTETALWEHDDLALLRVVSEMVGNALERKRAQEELQASEERFRLIAENASDVIWTMDLDANFTYISPSIQQVSGYTPEEAMGLGLRVLATDESFELARKEFQDGLTREVDSREEGPRPVTLELEQKRKDGTLGWAEVKVAVIRDQDGKPISVQGVTRDVTERKESEKQLQESEESFRTIFDSAAYGILLADMVTKRFHMANRTISEMIGYSRSELQQLDMASIHPEEALSFVLEQFEKQAQGEITTARSLPIKRKDGSVFYADVTSAPLTMLGKTYLMGIFSDITDRKEAEEALRNSEARYRMLADNVTDSIWTMDMDLRLTYSSPAFTKLTGYTLEEVQDLTIGQILTPASVESITSRILDVFAREQSGGLDPSEVLTAEVELYCKDGSTVWTETSARFLRDENGQAIGMLGVSRDITERKRVEEEKQRMEQQLLLSGRLAAVGELAAGVAHELNNPLAAVQGYAQLLATKQDLDEAIRQDVETIYREAQRASRITANLLSFSRRHEPERKPVSVNNCIEKSLELHAYRMRVNNIEISTELQADLPTTMADFYQLQQVFVNIITNAEQAMTESNGRGKLEVTSQLSGDMIQVRLSDDGPGMPEEVLSRAFDPFFTTKDVGKGTGLGLSICYGLIQQHGGHIRAESSPDKGTTILVEIPVISENQASVQWTGETRRASA
jgi:PAS domain S-box-containing protein